MIHFVCRVHRHRVLIVVPDDVVVSISDTVFTFPTWRGPEGQIRFKPCVGYAASAWWAGRLWHRGLGKLREGGVTGCG